MSEDIVSPSGIGIWVRSKRKSRGWTLRDLSGRTGYSVSYISDIERGFRGNTGWTAIKKISAALGYDCLVVMRELPNAP